MDPLQELAPAAFEALVKQNEAVMAEGTLPTRVKEMIAVALSISNRCEPCLRVHVKHAREAGAIPEAMAETIAVAILMEGGPAYVWSKRTMTELYLDEPTGD